jgi:putative PIN family toxin of toxin-antitoxin system
VKVVFDTCILVSAARSQLGASHKLVQMIPSANFQIALSVGLYTQWQDVLTRSEHLPPNKTAQDALRFVRYLASKSWLQDIYFLWRPFLKDADDDLVLELAVAARCSYIVTHNIRDFKGSDSFGVTAIRPQDFLKIIPPTS